MSRNIELQEQLRRHLILPYLYQQFLPAYTSEHYAAYAAHSITADASKHFTQLMILLANLVRADHSAHAAGELGPWLGPNLCPPLSRLISRMPSTLPAGKLLWMPLVRLPRRIMSTGAGVSSGETSPHLAAFQNLFGYFRNMACSPKVTM